MGMGKKGIMKKLAIIFGAFFFLLVAAMVVIPLVVDVDKYRPQMVEVANQYLNGKFEMGKLTLSLWGQIKVKVSGFSVSDIKGNKVVAARDVFFHVPFLPVLSGSPVLTFKMKKPELYVIKDAKGKMNVLGLAKISEPKPTPVETQAPTTEPQKAPFEIPGIVAKARLGVDMLGATLLYRDEKSQLESRVEDLNLKLSNLSLSHTTQIEMWANLNTRFGTLLEVKGPIKLTGQLVPDFNGGKFNQASLDVDGDASGLEIKVGEFFFKKNGLSLGLVASMSVSPSQALIKNTEAKFHNVIITVEGAVSGLDALATGGELTHEFKVKSNEIELAPWSELVPMLRTYELSGTAFMKAESKGPLTKPEYQVDLGAKNVSAKGPMLKAKPELNVLVNVVTDQVKNMALSVKAPGNDLSVKGNLVSFEAPKFSFDVLSTGMDLDQLVEFPASAKADEEKTAEVRPETKQVQTGKKAKPGVEGKASDFDAMLDPVRKMELAAKTSGEVKFEVKFIKVYDIRMDKVQGAMSMKDLAVALDRFSMMLFSGKISSSGKVQLKPAQPVYQFASEVDGLVIQQAVASKLELFKNTLTGKASFKMSGSGKSFNPEPVKKNLEAKGSMNVADGTFATIDVGRVVAQALNQTVVNLSQKIPQLKGTSVRTPSNQETSYESISSTFSLSGGKFKAPDFFAKSRPNKGIDLKGSTTVGIIDYSLAADWQVIDTYNMSKAYDVSVSYQGVDVPHIFSENGEPVRFPLTVRGTLFKPTFSYTSVPESLAKVAMNNATKAVSKRAEDEVKKRAREEIQKQQKNAEAEAKKQLERISKQAPQPAQDALQKIKKKLPF